MQQKIFKYRVAAEYHVTACTEQNAKIHVDAMRNSLEWTLNNVEIALISDKAPQCCGQQSLETPTAVTCQNAEADVDYE